MNPLSRHAVSRSIRARLTAIILAGTAAASVLYAGITLPIEAAGRRRALLERTEVTARLVGEYCVSPLAFGDVEGAQRLLSRLGGIPSVARARLFNDEGMEVAAYDRPGAVSLPVDRPPTGVHRFGSGMLLVHQSIVYDGSNFGSILVQASTVELDARLRGAIATAGLALLGVLALSWFFARRLHRGLSTRIMALSATMDRVSRERDYALRVDAGGEDEIGSLARGLNEMLGEVQRHQSEREEAQSRLARLGTAVEHAGDEVLITDASGIVQYVNPEFTRATGFAAEEAVGRPVAGESDEGGPNAEFFAALRRGRAWTGRVRTIRKDGKSLTEDATVSPIPGPSGEVVGYVVVRRDVTDRLRLERQLSQTQKLEALGTLAGGIAHDFNNILTGMIGLTEAARSDAPPDSPIAANLEEVLQGGQRAAGLVRKILTFGRRADAERVRLSLASVVREALDLIRASMPTTIEIRATLDDGVGVLASPTEIHQVVMNLCTNAGLAMRERGGRLVVSVRAAELDEEFVRARAGIPPGSYAVLSVADTGPGIDPSIRDRIFEPFFTTRGVGEGTGLGLSMVHGIVADLHGFVTLQSEPGHGATFEVFLPAAAAAAPGDAEPARSRGPARGAGERVLLVDDEPVLVRVATRALVAFGYQVTGFVSSMEALDRFRADPSAFDLMVTDLTMPGLTGEELASAVKAIRPDLPVILCSGFGEGMDASAPREAGIDACTAKPYTAEELAATVREVLDARRS